MELEHLISHEVPRSAILSGAAGTDIPSLRTFLEILLGNGPEYDSDDVDCYALPRLCYHIDDEVLAEEAPELTPLVPAVARPTSRRWIAYWPASGPGGR
jgi:hypothetical protein